MHRINLGPPLAETDQTRTSGANSVTRYSRNESKPRVPLRTCSKSASVENGPSTVTFCERTSTKQSSRVSNTCVEEQAGPRWLARTYEFDGFTASSGRATDKKKATPRVTSAMSVSATMCPSRSRTKGSRATVSTICTACALSTTRISISRPNESRFRRRRSAIRSAADVTHEPMQHVTASNTYRQ